jgi:cytochrome c oxidase subunit II
MSPPSTLPKRTTITFAAALVTASLIGACGGDEEADYSGDAPGGATSDAAQNVEVTVSDFSFTPGNLTAKTGDPFDLVLTNSGDAPHTFTIDEFDVDSEVAAGEETTVSITASDSGEFTYYCRFHRQQGMEGSIKVSGAGAAGDDSDPTESPADDGYYDY